MNPTDSYIDIRNGAYYVAGTRIGLDVIAYEFREGRSAEAIFEAYPAIGSLAKVYGSIAFILDHPIDVDVYLAQQDQRFEDFRQQNPLPLEMAKRIDEARQQLPARGD